MQTVVMIFAGVVIFWIFSQRFQIANTRARLAIDKAEHAFCEKIVHETANNKVAVFQPARDALRLGSSDPYALFMVQLARFAEDPSDERALAVLGEGEQEAFVLALSGDPERAREEILQLTLDEEILSGRSDLWMRLLGSLSISLAQACRETE